MACFTGSSRRVFHRHDGCSGKTAEGVEALLGYVRKKKQKGYL